MTRTRSIAWPSLLVLAAASLAACNGKTDSGGPLPNVPATVPVAASATAMPAGVVATDATPPAGGASGIAAAVANAASDSGSGAAGGSNTSDGASSSAQAGHGAETSGSKSMGPGNGSTAVGGMGGGQATGGKTDKKSAPTAGDGTAGPAKSASQ